MQSIAYELIETKVTENVNNKENILLKRINYKELGMPVGPYSHAVIHANTIYTSGITAFGTEAEKQDISKQLREIFRQISFICEQQKTSLDNLIKVTLYITNWEEMQQVRQTLFDIYGEQIPASSLIQVDRLFSNNLKVEVEAIIAVNTDVVN